jgi:hypothetical protein
VTATPLSPDCHALQPFTRCNLFLTVSVPTECPSHSEVQRVPCSTKGLNHKFERKGVRSRIVTIVAWMLESLGTTLGNGPRCFPAPGDGLSERRAKRPGVTYPHGHFGAQSLLKTPKASEKTSDLSSPAVCHGRACIHSGACFHGSLVDFVAAWSWNSRSLHSADLQQSSKTATFARPTPTDR